MKLSFGVFLALAAAPAASALRSKSLNEKLLAKARFLDGEVDFTWVANYAMKFEKCHTLIQVADEENEAGSLIYRKNLVTFHLCPSDTCETHNKGCGQYVVGMEEFVDMYTEAKLEEQEWICENIRENCYCNNADDEEACENQCYMDQGQDACVEYEGQEAFEIQEYLECREIENQNGNNGNYQYEANGAYYYEAFVGPYCSSDGYKIHLGVFHDEFCSVQGLDSVYSDMNYGNTLLYSAETGESIVEHDCVDCMEVDRDANNNNNNNNNGNNNGNDQEDEDQVVQMCEELYQFAGRCESNVETQSQWQYQDTTGCEYINSILPKLEQSSKSVSSGSSSGGGTASVVLAWIFAFTTLALGIYAFLLFRKLRRSKVNLSEQSGEMS